MSVQYFEGVGRRKESIARVRIMNGSGVFTVNQKEAAVYFPRLGDMEAILAPIQAAGQDAGQRDGLVQFFKTIQPGQPVAVAF